MNLLMITRVLLEVKNLKLFLQLPKLMNEQTFYVKLMFKKNKSEFCCIVR